MSDHDESVSPLFNKMDALMARHRGGSVRPDDDVLPVLTEVADADADALELDPLDIPVLTVEAAPVPSALMFDPKEFLTHQPAVARPVEVVPEPAASKAQPEFLDLPLLDLDSLLEVPAPFGEAAHSAARANAPVQEDLPVGTPPDALAPSAETLQWETPVTPPAAIVDEAAFSAATDIEVIEPTALQWEDAPSAALTASVEYQSEAAAIETLQAVTVDEVHFADAHGDDDIPVLTAEAVIEEGTDWEPVSPWWDDAATTETVTVEAWAESAGQGFVADASVAAPSAAADTNAEAETAVEAESQSEPVFTVEFTHVGESRLEVDLDELSLAAQEVPVIETEAFDPEVLNTHAAAPAVQTAEALLPSPEVVEPQPEPIWHVEVVSVPASLESPVDTPVGLAGAAPQEVIAAVPAEAPAALVSAPELEPNIETVAVPFSEPALQASSAPEPAPEPEPIAPAALAPVEFAPVADIAAAPPEAAAAQMDASAIAEVTAGVAAHLAVDISTEVERLTRQHFQQMMQSLYGEAVIALVEKVSLELEARLAPRIDELVRAELRNRGLLD